MRIRNMWIALLCIGLAGAALVTSAPADMFVQGSKLNGCDLDIDPPNDKLVRINWSATASAVTVSLDAADDDLLYMQDHTGSNSRLAKQGVNTIELTRVAGAMGAPDSFTMVVTPAGQSAVTITGIPAVGTYDASGIVNVTLGPAETVSLTENKVRAWVSFLGLGTSFVLHDK